jgi:hypothetical protein
MTEVIRKAEQELKWSVFPRFSIELALLKLIYMDSSVSVEQLLEAFQKKRADALLPTGPASLPLPAAPMPIFPKQDPVAKKKIDLTVFSPGASADVAAPQTATGISLERQAREPSVSINDDIKREPIIKTVLDIFDGDLIR